MGGRDRQKVQEALRDWAWGRGRALSARRGWQSWAELNPQGKWSWGPLEIYPSTALPRPSPLRPPIFAWASRPVSQVTESGLYRILALLGEGSESSDAGFHLASPSWAGNHGPQAAGALRLDLGPRSAIGGGRSLWVGLLHDRVGWLWALGHLGCSGLPLCPFTMRQPGAALGATPQAG